MKRERPAYATRGGTPLQVCDGWTWRSTFVGTHFLRRRDVWQYGAPVMNPAASTAEMLACDSLSVLVVVVLVLEAVAP